MAALEQMTTVASLEDKRLLHSVHAQAADLRRLLREHVAKARQMLRKLDVNVVCEPPFEENGKKGYRFTVTETYIRILGSVNVGCGPFPAPTTSATTRWTSRCRGRPREVDLPSDSEAI
jgi:hypothetical protein